MNSVICPGKQEVIPASLCWEYCFADHGGPSDTAAELKEWILKTKKYKDISEFHKVCETCVNCQWSNIN
ncbi:hypothetical protein PATA110616_20830 [Paenibacillus tarimensis]